MSVPRRRPFSAITKFFSSKEVDVCIEEFDVLQLLGAGAYGKVYKAVDRTSGKEVALKVIRKSNLKPRDVKMILSEQDAFVRTLGNSHTLQLAASFHDAANYYMAVALHTGGDLQRQIDAWDGIPQDITKFYAAELLVGIFSLHRKGVLHRDIKPGNILLDKHGHVVIADFGLSKAPYLTSGCCGTLSHMAPEILLEQKYGFAVDYWALAITIYEMLTGEAPWYNYDQREFIQQICHAPLVCPETVSPEAKDLLTKVTISPPFRDPD
ncbi:hypothetical protein HYDPIDRAFT_91621 [Hydnomerulius pinastri MD-312]|uniref:Protein kinase domain-containing protein n=1 Tax=Hydnomerulius pinastri MD-312 TaxID=994086 RepID=A0A0C9WF03_9AGAM|nr:hypothetical protein HYDPIDRAFT_91621 [Hydnomerulius pinastri MD-312]